MENQHQEQAKIFSALSDPKRLAILDLLRTGEKCACVLLEKLSISQSGLSYHMRILCDSGIVLPRQEGKWTYYSLSKEGGEAAAKLLLELTTPVHKTPLYILTGFLGAGKTTVLLKLLQQQKAQGKSVGVIQNDLGKLGVDSDLIAQEDVQLIGIGKGSIFCSCRKLDFVKSLAEFSNREFDYLFVESSGMGDPSNVEEILQAVRELCGDIYDFRGILCFVDALHFLDQLGDLEAVHRQLKHCQMAVLTKTDLVEEDRLAEVRRKIREINPVCEIKNSVQGDLDQSFLEEDLMQYLWAEPEETTNSVDTKPKCVFMNVFQPVEQAKFVAFLREVQDDLYRAKGFVEMEKHGWQKVDLVGDQMEFCGCADREKSQMEFIAKIGPAIIRRVADAWKDIVGIPMQLRN